MSTRRRLTSQDRKAIVRERAAGATHKTLAARFGVTERTIYYTLRTENDRRRDGGTRTIAFSVTVTPEEASAFDAVLQAQGIANRSDGLRRLIHAAEGVFLPDEDLANELRSARAALNRVGSNVTQIAKRMNEANRKGLRPSFGPGSLAQMRSLASFVLDLADRLHLLTERRRVTVTLRANDALKELADGAE